MFIRGSRTGSIRAPTHVLPQARVSFSILNRAPCKSIMNSLTASTLLPRCSHTNYSNSFGRTFWTARLLQPRMDRIWTVHSAINWSNVISAGMIESYIDIGPNWKAGIYPGLPPYPLSLLGFVGSSWCHSDSFSLLFGKPLG
jgi:hypothetical protein